MSSQKKQDLEKRHKSLNALLVANNFQVWAPVRGIETVQNADNEHDHEQLIFKAGFLGEHTANFQIDTCAELSVGVTYLNNLLVQDPPRGAKLIKKYNAGYLTAARSYYRAADLSSRIVNGIKSIK